MSITVKHVSKRFRDFGALRDVSLTIKRGELVALLGPSGSGKTTLLRIIAGLEKPDAGQVIVEKSATQKKRNAVGFVFQHYALFKHMTVFENVAFGLRMRRGEEKLSDDAIAAKVMKLLKLVHLDALHTRYPSQLSGGQRQRIALARALAVEPDILLLDEPFGALDAKVRKELRRWMRRLHEELNITSIFVTHDQEEAMEMADRVVVMSQGRIEQMGTPEQVYLTPANAFVYDFLGHYNEFDAWQLSDGSLLLNEAEPGQPTPASPAATPGKRGLLARLPGMGRLRGARDSAVTTTYRPARHAQPTGTKVKVFCRPHELEVHGSKQPGTVPATLVHINPAGALVKLELERTDGALLDAELPRPAFETLAPKRGTTLYVRPTHTKIFA
ncbi:MAG: sulfate ABC transporter ATP-binding protein [Azospirillum brasilense]|nr:MAG: sulfate ABC transporter ATP-binding protein [Azospirillum brasilense]